MPLDRSAIYCSNPPYFQFPIGEYFCLMGGICSAGAWRAGIYRSAANVMRVQIWRAFLCLAWNARNLK